MEEDQQQQLELRSLVMKLTKQSQQKKGIYKMLNTIFKRAGEGYYYALFPYNEVDAFALDFLKGCGFGVSEDHIVSQPHYNRPRQVHRYATITWQK